MLRPIGIATPADLDGVLPRLGQQPSGIWLSIATELSNSAHDYFGESLISVALRGSTARNTAIDGGSDIDIIAIVRDPPAQAPEDDIALNSKIRPDIKIEASVYQLKELLVPERHRWMRFSLAYSGWTVWGEDIIGKLPEPKIGPYCVGHLPEYMAWSKDYRGYFSKDVPDDERCDMCRWLMKSIVRSLFESIMFDEWAYTRDIYPCAKSAVHHYPEAEDIIWAAAELAVSPVGELETIDVLVDAIRPTLKLAYERYYASN
jgi:hypothetical protein